MDPFILNVLNWLNKDFDIFVVYTKITYRQDYDNGQWKRTDDVIPLANKSTNQIRFLSYLY